MTKNTDLQISIDEMKILLNRQYNGMNATKDTARSLLSSANLVIAILGALQIYINTPVSPTWTWIYRIGILISLALYITLIYLCVQIISPIDMYGPIVSEWSKIRDSFFDKNDRDVLKMQLSGYLNAIDLNSKPLEKRRDMMKVASILLPIIVSLMLLLSLLTR